MSNIDKLIITVDNDNQTIEAILEGRKFLFKKNLTYKQIEGAITDILIYENEISRIKEEHRIMEL